MGDVVNLKRIRKRTEQDQAAKQAEINRARFGRPKAERVTDKLNASRERDRLERHRLSPGDDQ